MMENRLENRSLMDGSGFVLQGFGVAEGRPKEDLKNMANAAGQSCRDYTPPGGETLDQVSRSQITWILQRPGLSIRG